MALADIWSRTLVYFGIAEEDDDWDEDGFVTNEELERTYSDRERANVRRLQPRRRQRHCDSSACRRKRTRRGQMAAPCPVPRQVPRQAPRPSADLTQALMKAFSSRLGRR